MLDSNEIQWLSNRFIIGSIVPHLTTPCWDWLLSVHNTGYGQAKFRDVIQLSHRISYQIYYGDIPPGICVLHDCDNRLCVNPEHLHLGTKGENNREKSLRNRCNNAVGEDTGSAVLTEAIVIDIRSMKPERGLYRRLRLQYDVDWHTIQKAATGNTWSYLNPQYPPHK